MSKLQEIYDRVPEIDCKGECHDACGPIAYSGAEERRIQNSGESPPEPMGESHTCNKLTAMSKQCTIYEDRPLICRLFGVVEGMKCPHGCEPEEYLSDKEAFELLSKAEEL